MDIKEAMAKPYGMTTKMLPKETEKTPPFTRLENTMFFLESKKDLHWSGSLCGSHQVQLLAPSRKNFCHHFTHRCVQSSFEHLSSGSRSYLSKQTILLSALMI